MPQTAISFNPYGNAVYVIQEVQRAEGENIRFFLQHNFVHLQQKRG